MISELADTVSLDDYLTDFTFFPLPNYNINRDDDRCPKCNGVIILDHRDAVCLNCGLRDTITVDYVTHLEDEMIQWLIRNLPRQLFATFDFLDQNLIGDDTKYIRIPSSNGVINSHVESLLLQLAELEQRGVIRIHPRGVISDYEYVIVVYDVLDRDKINKRLVPVGIL